MDWVGSAQAPPRQTSKVDLGGDGRSERSVKRSSNGDTTFGQGGELEGQRVGER